MSYPRNCPDLDQLVHMPPQEIAALPADVLALLQHESETALKCAKAIKAKLDGGLALKYGEQAATARRRAAKDTGTVRFGSASSGAKASPRPRPRRPASRTCVAPRVRRCPHRTARRRSPAGRCRCRTGTAAP
jgi:hypothetical protein